MQMTNLDQGYYACMFTGEQRTRSRLLKQLWAADHFHNEWTLLTQTYSFVRDQSGGRLKTPMKTFLLYACPAMGIVAPNAYLATFNWQATLDPSGNIYLAQTAAPTNITHTGLSNAQELLEDCFSRGYYVDNSDEILEMLATSATGVMNSNSAQSTSVTDNLITFQHLVVNDPHEAARRLIGTTATGTLPVRVNVVQFDAREMDEINYALDYSNLIQPYVTSSNAANITDMGLDAANIPQPPATMMDVGSGGKSAPWSFFGP